MLGSLVITLREGTEAALVIGILLAYLAKTGQASKARGVWLGTALAVLVSLVAGGLIFFTVGELEEIPEHIFASGATLAAVVIMSYTIYWMHQHASGLRSHLEHRAARAAGGGSVLALTGLAFLVIVREGIETALFLFGAAQTTSPTEVVLGAATGLLAAVALGLGLYRGGLHLDLRAFFVTTAVLLTFFAAGMLMLGLRELIEIGYLPGIVDPVWDSGALLPEQSLLGQLFRALLGYSATPSLLEALAYAAYLLTMLAVFFRSAPALSRATVR